MEMYCVHCGNQMPDGSSFCAKCGKPLQLEEPKVNANGEEQNVPATESAPVQEQESGTSETVKAPVIKDTTDTASNVAQGAVKCMAWILAVVPSAIYLFFYSLAGKYSSAQGAAIGMFLVSWWLCWGLDIAYLKKAGHDTSKWSWFGFLLMPVYLFVRAAKIDKQWGPAITYCMLMAIPFITGFINGFAIGFSAFM